ncbi:MAG: primase-helicase family protein [Paludibacteraceae bacterium]
MAKKMTTEEKTLTKNKVVSVAHNKYDENKWQKPAFLVYTDKGEEYWEYPPYKPKSYCEQRVGQELGLPAEENKIAIVSEYGHIWEPLFRSDSEDNIEITVCTLDREMIPLEMTEEEKYDAQHRGKEKQPGFYKLIRLNPKNVSPDGGKYKCPSKIRSERQYPYFSPELIAKWENREYIDTLVITEGYFKAFKACRCGADVVGIGGISMFTDSSTGSIHRDVKRLVIDCGIKNLVFLHDGDCTDISEKALQATDANGQPTKDLSERPSNFKQSVERFYRQHHAELPGVTIWWYYVNSDAIPGHPKGLDDLLVALPDQTERIVYDLQNPEQISPYFFKLKLNTERQRLNDRFFLDSAKSFYTKHKEQIKERAFLYFGTIYRWNAIKGELDELMSKDLMVLKRIGGKWYKEVKKPTLGRDATGNIIYAEILIEWSRQNIIDDFGSTVINKLARYDGFVNMPSHDNYQKVIGNFYNLYKPLTHKPSDEDLHRIGWKTIHNTMEHIFGTDNRGRGLQPGMEGYDPDSQYEIGMDYVQLLYTKPTQNLPILCLVSTERGTGKTTFLDMLQIMFGENTVIVGNGQMQTNFNTLISGRLIVGVDESSLADNKKFTEDLKMWSTAKKQTMEGKGDNAVQIENFTKYILCSNNETRFIYASAEEVRFWVRKINPLPEDQKIGNILPFYEREMPAFMAYLNQREMHYAPEDETKLDRMYFHPDMLHTPWLDRLLEAQRPRAERKMRDWLHQWFIDFAQQELLTTLDKLQDAITYTDRKFSSYDVEDLKRFVEENMHVRRYEGGKSKRFRFQIISPNISADGGIENEDKPGTTWIYGNGRPYVFKARDFLSPQEYNDLFPGETATNTTDGQQNISY